MAMMWHSDGALMQAIERADRAENKLAKEAEQRKDMMGRAISIAETAAGVFGFSYANGRWADDGELKVMGVPVDLGVGLVCYGLGFFGAFGKWDEHLIDFGTGALGSYLARLGSHMGAAAKAGGSTATAGLLGAGYASAGALGAGNGVMQYQIPVQQAA